MKLLQKALGKKEWYPYFTEEDTEAQESNLLLSHRDLCRSTSPLLYAKTCLRHGKEAKPANPRRIGQHKNLRLTKFLPPWSKLYRDEHQNSWIERRECGGSGDAWWWVAVSWLWNFSELRVLSWPYLKSVQTTLKPCLAPRLRSPASVSVINRPPFWNSRLCSPQGTASDGGCISLQPVLTQLLIKHLKARPRMVSPYQIFRKFLLLGFQKQLNHTCGGYQLGHSILATWTSIVNS